MTFETFDVDLGLVVAWSLRLWLRRGWVGHGLDESGSQRVYVVDLSNTSSGGRLPSPSPFSMSCSASRLLARRLFSSTTMSSSPTTRRVALRGDFILDEPEFNKGTAFSKEERQQFGLVSRLPAMVNTLDEQCERAYHQLQSEEDPLKKNSVSCLFVCCLGGYQTLTC